MSIFSNMSLFKTQNTHTAVVFLIICLLKHTGTRLNDHKTFKFFNIPF